MDNWHIDCGFGTSCIHLSICLWYMIHIEDEDVKFSRKNMKSSSGSNDEDFLSREDFLSSMVWTKKKVTYVEIANLCKVG